MARDACDRHGGRDVEEDQQRGHQKPAADAKHAGDESDGKSHCQDHEHIDRQVGDWKVDLHGLIRWFEMREAPVPELKPMRCIGV